MMTSGSAIRTPVLLAALAGIAVLAIVLPFGAVHALHAHRLERADADLRRIAGHVRLMPRAVDGAQLWMTSGDMPRIEDRAWLDAPAVRLAGDLPGPDPWGNAYFVRSGPGPGMLVISAGPDGVLQTVYRSEGPAAGDDRLVAWPFVAPGGR